MKNLHVKIPAGVEMPAIAVLVMIADSVIS